MQPLLSFGGCVMVAVADIASCSALYSLNPLGCSCCIWIPNRLAVFKGGSEYGLWGLLLHLLISYPYVMVQEVEGSIGFGSDSINVVVPAKVLRDLHSQVLDGISTSPLFAMKEVLMHDGIYFPADGSHFTFAWVEFHTPGWFPMG